MLADFSPHYVGDEELYSYHFWSADQVFRTVLAPVIALLLVVVGAFAERNDLIPWSEQAGVPISDIEDVVATALAENPATATPSPIPDTASLRPQ